MLEGYEKVEMNMGHLGKEKNVRRLHGKRWKF